MSLDQRCQQFHEAALGTGKSKGPVREIATLRKFLHKNQDQRFTDKAVSRLFDTIQLYSGSSKEEGLLEDALKMPFTLFSTKQKKTMIKWLEDLRGQNDDDTTHDAATSSSKLLSLIDITEDHQLSLMNDETGDTYEDLSLPEGELGRSIKTAFDNTDGVVMLVVQFSGFKVGRIVGMQ